jgi:hypothetical protein
LIAQTDRFGQNERAKPLRKNSLADFGKQFKLIIRDPESCGTGCALRAVASLMKLIKTPPPTLLRARFATVLDHLPSVPSVVLPILSLVETDRALFLLNTNKVILNKYKAFER